MPQHVVSHCTRRCEELPGAFAPSGLVADILVCHFCGETRRAPGQPIPSAPRVEAARPLFTLGYAGLRLEQALLLLQAQRVEVVVDTRWTAWSGNPGFCQDTLRRALEGHRIAYRPLPTLGASPALRRQLEAEGDWEAFAAAYRAALARQDDLLKRIATYAQTHRLCLLCREHAPGHCHRSILAECLAALAGLTIEHLKAW